MAREIKYEFSFEDGSSWAYTLNFDAEHHFVPAAEATQREIKGWTRLKFNQCPHCPLSTADTLQCPVARNLDQMVEDSKNTLSITRALVTVTTPERTISRECATQDGLRSLFGVIMASSACPHLDWLRPLARFHLPFADTDETLFRVLSLQLLHQFFNEEGSSLESASERTKERYSNVEKVNHAFIGRIRSYCDADADKNAIAALDVFVQLFQYQAEGDFGSLRKYF